VDRKGHAVRLGKLAQVQQAFHLDRRF
jgi:hypothetical protein